MESLRSLALCGRLLSVGFAAGDIPAVRLNRLLLNNVDVRGVSWGPYARQYRASPGGRDDLQRLVASGSVRPPLRHVRPLADIAEAMTAMLQRRTLGKTVLTLQ